MKCRLRTQRTNGSNEAHGNDAYSLVSPKRGSFLRVVLSRVSRDVASDDLSGDAGSSSLVSITVGLNGAEDGDSGVELAGDVTDGVHGNEHGDSGAPDGSTGGRSADEDEGSKCLSDELLDVEGGRSGSGLGLSSLEPLVGLPGKDTSENLASNANEKSDMIVGSAVDVVDNGHGGIQAGSRDDGCDGESSADLHEVSISGEDSGDEKEGSDNFGNVCCSKEIRGLKKTVECKCECCVAWRRLCAADCMRRSRGVVSWLGNCEPPLSVRSSGAR